MIVRKTWERYKWVQIKQHVGKTQYRDVYTGWFLFGIIPLFIDRDRTVVG